jgi:hypothetical protein
MTTYTIKAIKTFHGHDGYGWECKLYADKKCVAFVVEDGYGGDLQFNWADHSEPRVKSKGVGWKDAQMVFKDTPAESALRAFCLTLPKWECNDTFVYTSRDIFVSDLVNTALYLKDVKKLLKKVAILENGTVYTYNCPPTHPTVRDQIAKKYPNAVILNDLPLADAVAAYTENAQ